MLDRRVRPICGTLSGGSAPGGGGNISVNLQGLLELERKLEEGKGKKGGEVDRCDCCKSWWRYTARYVVLLRIL